MWTHRDRILALVNHEEPDRIGISYSAAPEVHKALKEFLRIPTDEDLLEYLGVDLRYVSPRIKYKASDIHYADPTVEVTSDGILKDIWGVGFVEKKTQVGTYIQLTYHPLQSIDSIEDLESYPWPTADLWDYSDIPHQMERLKDYPVFIHSRGFFEISWFMRGMDNFLVDLSLNPALACRLMDKVKNYLIARLVKGLEAGKGRIDFVELNDDVGGQNGLLISPAMWRDYIKPRMKEMIDVAHSYGARIMYHSCGSVRAIIPDLIEIGVEILNPVQPRAAGMDPKGLKRDFGDKLTFYGTIDEQETLPYGKPEDVKVEVLERIRYMAPGGGFIISPCHSIQPDTPLENIMALYSTALEYGIYKK
ncbi:MAG TPA: uroporphyrinogen decarboxylase family protein [bacterium]|nr:uroporphyrinogen decarboxylase family protein [bacterium]